MKIGITGVSAFVGYHLAKELLKEHQIIGFDCCRSELAKEINDSNFKFAQGDISDFNSLKNAFGNGTDLIYHLAAISSERLHRENVERGFRVNVEGSLNILELARQKNMKVIYASSGAVYPASSKPHQEQEADFTDKFYGASKLIAEKYCRLYGKNFALSSVVLRFARIYGRGMTRNPIYDILKGLKNKKVKFYESLNSCYDFVYVKDIVQGLILAQNKEWENQIVNISSGRGAILKEVIKKAEKTIGEKIDIEVVQDVFSIDILDNTKAGNLGWQPKYSLEEGLEEIISH